LIELSSKSFAAFVVVLLAHAVFASAAETAADTQTTAVRLDGTRVTGALLSFNSAKVSLENAADGDRPVDLPRAGLLSLEFPKAHAAQMPESVLEFANGDRLHADVLATDGDVLSARFGANALAVPLETLRGITFRPLDPDDGTAGLLFRDEGENDLVLLTNGDRLAGQFAGLSESDLSIETEGRSVLVPRDRIAAIAFSPELTIPSTIEGSYQLVHTAGGWLTARDVQRSETASWSGTTAFGERVNWPKDSVERVQFFDERIVPLSSLPPAEEVFTPYLGRAWPVRENRAVTGESLAAGGKPFATGLGVHSRSRLRYELGGEYESFHVVAGLAESAGEIGSVEFAIELDGREVLRRGHIRKDAEPLRITNLDVSNVRSLVLTVDFGRNGDIRDRANWCDAILVRSKRNP
jgi:hypothetical protein